MDITNITQNLIKGLEQKNTEQLVTLSRLLNVALGKMVMASVTEIEPVTPQERDVLLAQTVKALLQVNKLAKNTAALSPALKIEITRLLDQQTLIKSPELKWVNLLVNGKSLLTYTDKPLAAGQTIPVQLVSPQKLVLLDLQQLNNITDTQKSPAVTFNLETFLSKTETSSQQIKQVVADNLRQLLPYKDKPTVLFSALNQWQNIPKANQQQLVSPTLSQALRSVAEQIRSPLQLGQPKILEQIIKNSGVFFENKLTAHSTAINQTTNQTISPTILNRTYTQDLKGSLLTLLSKVNQELTDNNKPLTTEQTVKLLQQVSSYIPIAGAATAPGDTPKNSLPENSLTGDIGLLIQQLMTKPVNELSDKELRTQLLILLQQHSLHSLAKIQLQQLTSLNHELDTKDSKQPNASWQIDIPVKYHNEVQQLHLHINREWVDDKNSSSENKTATKVKQWSVTLRFDLPTLGEFCAQVAIIDTSVSAILWATRETTFSHIKQHIENLRKNLEGEGIQVTQIQCIKGMPPQKSMALSYSLIDIST